MVEIFDYDDFGPQIMCHQLIGFQWFQWNSHGSSHPGIVDHIKVVVYEGLPPAEVQRRYPVEPKHRRDYRHLRASAARAYFRERIAELSSPRNRDPLLAQLVVKFQRNLDRLSPRPVVDERRERPRRR